MGKKRISCRARDRLRQGQPSPRPFVPAIGVEQGVLFTDDQARQYRSSMHDELGKRLGSDFRKRYRILKPEQMKLVLIDPVSVAEEVRGSHNKLRVEKAREIAYLLGERLEALLGQTEGIPLQIGDVAPFTLDHPRKPYRKIPMIGAYMFGWKGPKSPIATHDAEGNRQPLSMVRQVCDMSAETIAKGHRGIQAHALTSDPRVPVIEQKRDTKVPRGELMAIREAVGQSVPAGTLLGPPVLTVRTGASRNDVEVITLGSTHATC